MSGKIRSDKGQKDSVVPFPKSFRETLALYIENSKKKATCSFLNHLGLNHIQIVELEKYSKIADMKSNIYPHKLRHFLFTWLKKKGIDDALIQPYLRQ